MALSKQNKKTLKQIHAAIKIFPKVVKQKEKAFLAKKKILKNFAPFSKELYKITSRKK